MNFNVNFSTIDEQKSLVEKMGRPGLDILDIVREENPETKHLPADRFSIDNGCPVNGSHLWFELTEDQARATGLYRAATSIDVTVEEHSFSKYVINTVKKVYKDIEYTDGVYFCGIRIYYKAPQKILSRVQVENKFDYAALFSDWASAGFPLDWKQ